MSRGTLCRMDLSDCPEIQDSFAFVLFSFVSVYLLTRTDSSYIRLLISLSVVVAIPTFSLYYNNHNKHIHYYYYTRDPFYSKATNGRSQRSNTTRTAIYSLARAKIWSRVCGGRTRANGSGRTLVTRARFGIWIAIVAVNGY